MSQISRVHEALGGLRSPGSFRSSSTIVSGDPNLGLPPGSCLYGSSASACHAHPGSQWLPGLLPSWQPTAPKLTPPRSGRRPQPPSLGNGLGRALIGLASVTCTSRPIICGQRGHWAETGQPWSPSSSGVGGLRVGAFAGEGVCVMNWGLPSLSLCSVFRALRWSAAPNLLGTAPFIWSVKSCFKPVYSY